MWALVAVIASIVTSALAGAEPAHAGNYVMRSCNVPGHADSPLGPWVDCRIATPKMVVVDACAAGGGVGFRFVGPQQLHFGDGSVLGIS